MSSQPGIDKNRFLPLSADRIRCIDATLAELHTKIQQLSRELIIPGRESAARHFKDDSWGGQEVVTSTDLAVSEELLKIVKRDFPFSETEEHLAPELPKDEPFWQIDPIDGTKLYDPSFPGHEAATYPIVIDGRSHQVRRHPSNHCWGVMAALLEPTTDGGYLSRVGILHRPVLDESWVVGLDGVVRCYRGGPVAERPVAASKCGVKTAGIATVYSPLEFELELLKKAQLFSPDLAFTDLGGAISYYTAFLNGDINCFVFSDYGIKSWDFAAGYALLSALGARITHYDGSPIRSICNLNRRVPGGIRVAAPGIN